MASLLSFVYVCGVSCSSYRALQACGRDQEYVAYLIVSGNVNRGVNCIPFFLSDVSLLSQQL